MRRLLLLAGLLGVFLRLRANPAETAAAPPPGYELRALDQHKRVVFQVAGSQVEVSVPIFVYCPAAGAPPVVRLLRETEASLIKLAAQPEWTADELRQVLAGLDQAARLLEAPPLAGTAVAPQRD
jgi:hypothetical protein